MPVSGTVEFADQFGFLDSEPFLSASALDAHTLRTMAINVNALMTQVQPVYTGLWRPTSGSYNSTRAHGSLSIPTFNYWQVIQPPTIVQKPPGVRELHMRTRVGVTEGKVVAIQFVTYGSPFQEFPSRSSSTFFVTGSNSPTSLPAEFQLITGTIPCRVEEEEMVTILVRGFLDTSTDTLLTSSFGSGASAMVSSSFEYAGSGPSRFMPTVSSSAGGMDGTIANNGAYAMFYMTGSNNLIQGPVAIVSQSMAKGYDSNRQASHFLPPASQNLIGTHYKMYQSIMTRFCSIRLFTKRREN